MAKFLLTNLETIPFKKKSFKGQLDRYLKVCIASADNPQKVLLTMPLYGKSNGGGYSDLINVVRNHELGQDDKSEFPFSELLKPIEGEFVEVKSKHGPLFRIFKNDDAKYGICPERYVGKVERTPTGKVKIYNSIKIFIHYTIDNETGEKRIAHGWSPEELYYRFFGYNYHVLANLTEPLQL